MDLKKLQYPKDWNQVSFKVYRELAQEGLTDSWIVSIVTGLTHKQIQESRDTDQYHKILNDLQFLNAVPDFEELPTYVYFQGKKINMIKDLGNISVIQVEHIKDLISKHKGADKITLFSKAVSIFLQGLDQDYDYDKAMELVREVELMPAIEIVSIGGFFLKKSTDFINGTQIEALKYYKAPKKSAQGLFNWVRNMVLWLRYTRSQTLNESQRMK